MFVLYSNPFPYSPRLPLISINMADHENIEQDEDIVDKFYNEQPDRIRSVLCKLLCVLRNGDSTPQHLQVFMATLDLDNRLLIDLLTSPDEIISRNVIKLLFAATLLSELRIAKDFDQEDEDGDDDENNPPIKTRLEILYWHMIIVEMRGGDQDHTAIVLADILAIRAFVLHLALSPASPALALGSSSRHHDDATDRS